MGSATCADNVMPPPRTPAEATLAARPARRPGGRLLRPPRLTFARYGTALTVVLGAYMLFDRAAAYLRVPGTPLYLGECLLVLGILTCASAPGYLRSALRDEPILAIVAAIVLWGLARAVPNAGTYGVIDTVRDSALWYYSLFAVIAVAATLASPRLPDRLVDLLARRTPVLLLWLPIVVVIQKVTHIGVHVPGSTVSVVSSKDGNVAVVTFIALAAMWLVPWSRRSPSSRKAWSLIAMAGILMAGTQNRGGLVAVSLAALIGLLMNRRLIRPAVSGALVVVALIALATPFIPHTGGTSRRSISPTQLVQNIASVAGVGKAPDTQGTQQARERQWSFVLGLEFDQGKMLYGFGSGPNLGFGQATGTGDETLRVPHNSHVDVIARLGLIGLGLWVLLWSSWFYRLGRARARFLRGGQSRRRGMVDLCIVAAVAILTNAFFDPSLEGAQVGALLWTVFGLGLVLTNPRWTSRTRLAAEAA